MRIAVNEPEADTSEPSEGSSPAVAAPRAFWRPAPLHQSPPLAIVAAVAAVLDLVLRRGLLRTVSDRLGRSDALALHRILDVPMNLAAIAGTVAATVGLFRLLAASLHPPWNRPPAMVRLAEGVMRAVTAGFAGILLPTVVIATFLPAERTTQATVFAATASAYLLVLQVAFTAARFPAPAGLRVATALLGASALGAFGAMVLAILGPFLELEWAYDAHRVLATSGELAFLFVPVAALTSVLPDRGAPRTAWAIFVGTTVGVCAMVTFDVWRVYLGSSYEAVLYGAVRFEAFLESAGLVYAVPFGLYLGLGLGTLCASRAGERQIGAAALLLLGAGYGPRTPGQLLMMVLGVTLLARSTIAAAQARVYGADGVPEPEGAPGRPRR